MPAIEVSHVTKEYRLGALQSLKQNLMNTGARLLGRKVEEPPLFKALDDVSFTVEQGEVVGIIGHNGAGKSTLLKMLARISTPSSGSVKINGRISPLIEVGAGFVPDFTGRENVYLNGAILGMSKREIDGKFDEIVDFAEMAEFIDTPVKRYSSGMQVKLAFAVATSVESEILIVDEVLAVGDLAFQRKCFDRMEHLIKREGKTVLLVSHNIRQVERLCSRVLMLEHGTVVAEGKAYDVCRHFYQKSQDRIREVIDASPTQVNVSGTLEAALDSVVVLDDQGAEINAVPYRGNCSIRMRFRAKEPLRNVAVGVGVHTTDFLNLATQNSEHQVASGELGEGLHEFVCHLRDLRLLPGTYALRIGLSEVSTWRVIYYAENVISFQVIDAGHHISQSARDGFFELDAAWSLRTVSDEPIQPTTTPRGAGLLVAGGKA